MSTQNGLRYTLRILDENGNRFKLVDIEGNIEPLEPELKVRDLFRVDDRGMQALINLKEQLLSNPTAYGMNECWRVTITTMFGGGGCTVWSDRSCPRCETEALNMYIEGVDVETKKRINVERCGHCFYSNYVLEGDL